jgi:hypothetical protein
MRGKIMAKTKQYKLKFKPTPVSRLLRRPSVPFQHVGYPYSSDWAKYYKLNYEFMLKEAKVEREYGSGPFADDYAAIHA